MTLRRFRPMHRIALAMLAALALGAAACGEDGEETGTEPAVSAIPWTAPETYSYVIFDNDDEEQGRGTLSVVPGDDGTIRLVQSFSDDDGNADDSVVVVNAQTLAPQAGRRIITDADEDRRVEVLSRYGDLDGESRGVRIAQLSYEDLDDTEASNTRCSPMEIEAEHYYDNDVSLFLWRAIRFEEDYSVNYRTVLTNRREARSLSLRVVRQEPVAILDGSEQDAWLVHIEGEGRETQRAWFATTPDHRLLRYSNAQDQLFLFAGEGEPPQVEEIGELPEQCE